MKKARRTAEQPRVKAPDRDVVLWRPRIVIASRIEEPLRRPPVKLAPPAAHAQTGPRVDTAILSLADASASLVARAADARARASEASEASSTRERLEATLAAYRLEASFDQVLAGTYRQITALMEERGLA